MELHVHIFEHDNQYNHLYVLHKYRHKHPNLNHHGSDIDNPDVSFDYYDYDDYYGCCVSGLFDCYCDFWF